MLRDQLRESFRAEGSSDDLFFDEATQAAWKLRRIEEWTTMLIAAAFQGQPVPAPLARLFGADDESAMKRLERYEATARGALNRSLSHLRGFAAERAKERARKQAAETQAHSSPKPAQNPRNRTNPIPAPQTPGPTPEAPRPDAAPTSAPPAEPTSGSSR